MTYTVALVLGTHLPKASMPGLSHNDKSIHFLAYAVLGLLVLAYGEARWGISRRRLCWIVFGLGVFAALDEWTQNCVPGRYASFGDWYADTVGVVSAAMVWCVVEIRAVGQPKC